ncbi:MAG: arsenate reductase family protein [Pseudomonadota bacterium]
MIVIYHNPDCGTSRNVVRIAQDSGARVDVIPYLETGWTRAQLLGLFAAASLTPRAALRETKSPAEALGLLKDDVPEDVLIEAMVEHPILVNRPIVCSPLGVRLCRPAEAVLDLLDPWPAGPYTKEDGTVIIDANGKRVRPV